MKLLLDNNYPDVCGSANGRVLTSSGFSTDSATAANLTPVSAKRSNKKLALICFSVIPYYNTSY
jgi:hypothetical protein